MCEAWDCPRSFDIIAPEYSIILIQVAFLVSRSITGFESSHAQLMLRKMVPGVLWEGDQGKEPPTFSHISCLVFLYHFFYTYTFLAGFHGLSFLFGCTHLNQHIQLCSHRQFAIFQRFGELGDEPRYDILGLPHGCSEDEIKPAFRRGNPVMRVEGGMRCWCDQQRFVTRGLSAWSNRRLGSFECTFFSNPLCYWHNMVMD